MTRVWLTDGQGERELWSEEVLLLWGRAVRVKGAKRSVVCVCVYVCVIYMG